MSKAMEFEVKVDPLMIDPIVIGMKVDSDAAEKLVDNVGPKVVQLISDVSEAVEENMPQILEQVAPQIDHIANRVKDISEQMDVVAEKTATNLKNARELIVLQKNIGYSDQIMKVFDMCFMAL